MGLLVQKYGGTSVATPARVRHVAERVLEARRQGHDVVVVVSAMGDSTDRLTALAHEVAAAPDEREMDMLLSSGETASMALLSMAINDLGGDAVSFMGSQCGIQTTATHQNARIERIDTERIRGELDVGRVVIVAGFQGVTTEDEITTLGRGGSDTTAVALAHVLGAYQCEILTDVDGVYTADPRVVPTARKLEVVSSDEMLELAGAGAGVLKDRAVEVASKFGVALHVRSSFDRQPGTVISNKEETMALEDRVIRGIAHDTSVAKVTVQGVPRRPGSAAALFAPLAAAGIDVDVIVQGSGSGGTTDLSFTVGEQHLDAAVKLLRRLDGSLGPIRVASDRDVGKIAVVGIGMRSHATVAATMFSALAAAQINIDLVSTSEIKITCVVSRASVEPGVRALHDAFELERTGDPAAEPAGADRKVA